jgi:hypothetical protein
VEHEDVEKDEEELWENEDLDEDVVKEDENLDEDKDIEEDEDRKG